VTVFLVRHAQAGSRSAWDGPDDTKRPLTAGGRRQAADLVGVLEELVAARPEPVVLSSPYRRCVQTVAPLAAALGVEVVIDARLSEGPGSRALPFVRECAANPTRNVVLCSHGDVIPWLLDHFRANDGLSLGPDPRCQKGSTWVLDGDGSGRLTDASYLGPS
jgi:broad specificity phosphatase PhoE